jgi:hypothetical protein
MFTAHQAERVDRVVEHFDRDLCIGERHGGACPYAARIFALRAGHRLVPLDRGVAAFLGRQIGEIDRERSERTHDAHVMAEAVHVLELTIEIEHTPSSCFCDGRPCSPT